MIDLESAATTLAFLGRREEAYRILRELLELEEKQYIQPAILGLIYGSLGDRDRAFAYFDKAMQERSLVASWLRDPMLDPIQSDLRWPSMFRRMGLKP